jgi:hypothetical protein
LLGVPAKFRAAQEIMYRAMVKDGALLPLDEQKTGGTGCSRYLANSRSHRGTLVRRDLLEPAAQGRFVITDSGRQFVQRWLDECGRAIKDYECILRQPD